MNKIREIFSQKLKLSGIRGCMAAGAMTAGIAALAVIGGINSEDISTVNLETDVIPEETAAVETEKKGYSHDIEYFSSEDMEKMNPDSSEPSENEAAAEAAEPDDAEEETAVESFVTEEPEQPEETAISEEETEEAAAEEEESSDSDEAYETVSEEEIPEDIPQETSGVSEETNDTPEDTEESEPEQETSESVSARLSAAGGDDDNSGLSSALDFATVGGAANVNASDEEMIIIDRSAPKAESAEVPAENEEASADAEESDIPEDISLEDEQEEEAENPAPGPQEGAISLFDLPEWLEFDENGIPTEYTAVLTGKACAYTAAPDALMSTGKTVFQGYVAVDPDIIPYGTELYIVAEDGEVYGYAIAADTGYSVRKGHIIVDLFMNEYDDCIQWGNKPVYVYVLR